jgi:glycerol-3-phosphate dehydrogenase
VRYARAYGTRIERLLAGRGTLADLGQEVVPGLFAAEIEYLLDQEWACSAADILWRRSRLGLHLPPGAARQLDAWIAQRRTAPGPGARSGSGAPRNDQEAHPDCVLHRQ